MLRARALLLLLLAASCGSPASREAAGSVASGAQVSTDPSVPSITFAADYTEAVPLPLVGLGKVQIAYDPSRLTACRGDLANGPGWSITGFYQVNGGVVSSFPVAGLNQGSTAPTVTLEAAGDLALWFENTSAWGCDAYDSNYGKNYHFQVGAPADAPGWIGNAASVIDRATCNGGPCDSSRHPLEAGFTFDTWARQRAAITAAYFEVWKQGTTDFDNPDLWKELDVQLHARIGAEGAFTTTYVAFDTRVGNNARYAIQLRALDPLGGLDGGALTSKSQCPAFATTLSADGQYLQADFEYYISVNGIELRPEGGGVFHGTYANYAGLYAVCQGP